MRTCEEENITNNSQVYNRAHKRMLEYKGKLNCCICPYHKGENRAKPIKNWKKYRKTQYRTAQVLELADTVF